MRFWIGAGGVLLCRRARRRGERWRQRVFLLRRLRGAAVRRARHRVEHPRRLRRLRELRHRRRSSASAPTRRWSCSRRPARRSRVQIAGAALMGGAARLRRRPAHAAAARHLLRHRHRRASSFIMETLMINWRYVGGATGLQLLRPAAAGAVRHLHAMLFVVMALLAVMAVAIARYIQTSWLGRGLRAIRDSEEAAECERRADAQAQALRLHRLRRADGRGGRADADVPVLHRAGVDLQPELRHRRARHAR